MAETFLTEHYQRCRFADAHLRTIAILSLGTLAGLTALLAPTLGMTLGLWAVVFSLGAYASNSMAALQLMTPAPMRAVQSAFALMVHTLGGMAFGNAIIGVLGDTFFHGLPRGIG